MKISKIYYLNLKSRTDRMYFMESQLSKIKIPYERFPATYIESEEELTTETSKFHDFYKRFSDRDELQFKKATDTGENFNYIKGAIGSCISHTLLLKKICEEDVNGNILLLEDDCVLEDGWHDALSELLDKNDDIDWDVIRCMWGQRRRHHIRKITNCHVENKNTYKKTTNRYGGAHFTLLNKNSIQKIYNYFLSEYVLPTDAIYTTTHLNVYSVKLKNKVNYLPGHLSDCDPELEH